LMTPVIAVIFQEAGCVTVVLSSTLLLWSKRKNAYGPEQKSNSAIWIPEKGKELTADAGLIVEPDAD
ncbi:MAG: hypothetical protein WCS96_08105, partial [Victivallales bacterium]